MRALADRNESDSRQLGKALTETEQTPQVSQEDFTASTIPESLVLSDGRILAYCEFGNADGFPVFYFHSIGSSRLECVLFDESAKRLGFRLIAIDRPGIGGSGFKTNLKQGDISSDVVELADRLRVQHFGLMSFSTGGIFALNTAYLNPSRVRFQLSLGGISGNFSMSKCKFSSIPLRVFDAVMPFSMKVLTRLKYKLTTDVPAANIMQLRELLDYTDRKILSNPNFSSKIELAMQESLRQGNMGVSHDTGLGYKHPGFQLAQIKVPVSIWQGGADNLNSRFANEFLAARLPSGSCHSVANRGHFFFIHCMDEIFNRTKYYMYGNNFIA